MSCNSNHKTHLVKCKACGYENFTCPCEVPLNCPSCFSEEDLIVEVIVESF